MSPVPSQARTIADLPGLVEQFCQQICYPHKLDIKGPHFRYSYEADPSKEVQFPHAEEPGCYVFANADGKILYVGKGSRHMGQRIWAPFGRQRRDGELDLFPDALPWVKEHKPGVWAVAVPRDHWWLAMALEGFLIETINPPENKRKR